jgi:transposase
VGCLASLIETAKLHGIDPQAYLADILAKLVNGWPVHNIDALLPWAWAKQQATCSLAA